MQISTFSGGSQTNRHLTYIFLSINGSNLQRGVHPRATSHFTRYGNLHNRTLPVAPVGWKHYTVAACDKMPSNRWINIYYDDFSCLTPLVLSCRLGFLRTTIRRNSLPRLIVITYITRWCKRIDICLFTNSLTFFSSFLVQNRRSTHGIRSPRWTPGLPLKSSPHWPKLMIYHHHQPAIPPYLL